VSSGADTVVGGNVKVSSGAGAFICGVAGGTACDAVLVGDVVLVRSTTEGAVVTHGATGSVDDATGSVDEEDDVGEAPL